MESKPKIEAPAAKKVRRKPRSKQIAVPQKEVIKKPEPKQVEVPEKKVGTSCAAPIPNSSQKVKKNEGSKQIVVPEKRKRNRLKRGSGITRTIPEVDDDDPFVDCSSQKRWSLKKAIEHIKKFTPKNINMNIASYKGGPVTTSTFQCFSNTLVTGLFRMYAILETDVQNSLHMFYFNLEESNMPRFRNLTQSLYKFNIFSRYPWLTSEEKLQDVVDVKGGLIKKKKNRGIEYSVRKPFSLACKQYEIEQKKSSSLINVEIKPDVNTMNQNLYLHDVNIPNISQENVTNNSLSVAAIESKIPVIQNDKYVLLSEEYKHMISAINQYDPVNESKKPQILEEIPQSSDSGIPIKRSRWSSPPIETNITAKIPTLETEKITSKLTPMMHFLIRKVKLTTQSPLSLGDLIVLVSYYYKLEYMEQQSLIEKMKILEATKPNQAAYLRQYVRTTCPLYNEDEIVFKPLPQELIMSEINMDLSNVTCIYDILEKDFCISEDPLHGKRIKIENTSHYLDDIKPASNEFDFGSAFL